MTVGCGVSHIGGTASIPRLTPAAGPRVMECLSPYFGRECPSDFYVEPAEPKVRSWTGRLEPVVPKYEVGKPLLWKRVVIMSPKNHKI